MQVQHVAACLCALLTLVGCTSTTDKATTEDGAAVDYNVGICETANHVEDVTACTPSATDYRPREGVSAVHGWPACISDDNIFHLVGESAPPDSSRSVAFEAIAPKLWAKGSLPTKDDFLSARDYADGRIPKYGTPGFALLHLRASYRLDTWLYAVVVVEHVLDSPYRFHGSSINGAGRGVTLQIDIKPLS